LQKREEEEKAKRLEAERLKKLEEEEARKKEIERQKQEELVRGENMMTLPTYLCISICGFAYKLSVAPFYNKSAIIPGGKTARISANRLIASVLRFDFVNIFAIYVEKNPKLLREIFHFFHQRVVEKSTENGDHNIGPSLSGSFSRSTG
jgi:hypothetical protein